jgi:hypothetical protein
VKLTTGAFAVLEATPGIGRAEALRRAMLSLIDKGKAHEAHPAYWAPFVVVGEGRAPQATRPLAIESAPAGKVRKSRRARSQDWRVEIWKQPN